MPKPTELCDPNRTRRNALLLFYAAAVTCGATASCAGAVVDHGLGRVGLLTMAGLSALIAVCALIQVFRAADELQRRINYQALAFAHICTLILSLVYGLLQQTGLRCASWLGVCGLLIALWSLGLILVARRYR
jgi:hypothetical protein